MLLHGKLITSRRRCGKPSCHCATGDRHETPALLVTEAGRTKTVTLTAADVAEVTAAIEGYQRARNELEAAAAAGLAALRARRAGRKGGRA